MLNFFLGLSTFASCLGDRDVTCAHRTRGAEFESISSFGKRNHYATTGILFNSAHAIYIRIHSGVGGEGGEDGLAK